MFTHPRDPYTRVDILPSSRHVRVEVDGVTIAETTKPTLLFETGLPVRYYLPKTHVRMDLLTPTESVSHCPYKGDAEYWSIRDRGERPRRRGVVVPDAASREPEDRRADQLLHREGRPLRRRSQAGLSLRRVLPRPALRARKRSGVRHRPARGPVRRRERGRLRPARLHARGAARDAGLAHPPRRARAAPGLRRRVLERGHGSTITLTCRVRQGTRLPIEMSLWAFESDGRRPTSSGSSRPQRAPPARAGD